MKFYNKNSFRNVLEQRIVFSSREFNVLTHASHYVLNVARVYIAIID